MPELPEVETVRRGLQPVLEGARLSRVEARRADLRFPFPEGFVQRLTGARIEALERRAKYLMARLDRGETLGATSAAGAGPLHTAAWSWSGVQTGVLGPKSASVIWWTAIVSGGMPRKGR